MPDIFDKETRSAVMSKVRSKGNKSTELLLMKLFKENGITGWRRNYSVEGQPDFVFMKQRIAVFVDGCFWHGHDCRNRMNSHLKKQYRRRSRKTEVCTAVGN